MDDVEPKSVTTLELEHLNANQDSKTAWNNSVTNDENERPFKTSYDIIKDYSEYSTCQGLIYIFFGYQTTFGRVFWSIMIFFMLVLGLYWTSTSYIDWENNPVTTSITTTAFPIEKVEFPAVTLCSSGMVWNVSNAGNMKLYLDYLERTNRGVDLNAYDAGRLLYKSVSRLDNNDAKKLFILEEILKSSMVEDYFNDIFPGANPEDDLNGLLNLLISRDPDSTLSTWGAELFSSTPHNDENKKFVPCDDNFAFDNSTENCYIVLKEPESISIGDSSCSYNFNAEHLKFESDDQVIGFLALINSGTLDLPPNSNGFFSLNAKRNRRFDFSFSKVAIKDTFKKLKIVNEKTSKFCLVAQHDPKLDYLNAFPTNCNDLNFTICRKSMHADHTQQQVPPKSVLEYYLHPKFNKLRKQLVASEAEEFRELFERLDQTKAYIYLITSFWYGTLPCFEIRNVTSDVEGKTSFLRYCEWKGLPVSCAAIFSFFPTDKGMCCTFNMKAAEEIFHGETYPKIIRQLQNEDKRLSFLDTTPPTEYSEKNEPQSSPGRNKGLVLVLDAHTDIIDAATSDSNYKGYMALISPTGSYPYTVINGLDIKPGHNNLISLTGTSIDSDNDLRSLPPEDRNCYFPDETKTLVLHKNYSYFNCIFECNVLYTRTALNDRNVTKLPCMPWFFPSADKEVTMCNPWEAKKFLDFMVNEIPDGTCKHCLPDCSGTLYDASLTTTGFQKCLPMNFGISSQCNVDNPNLAQPFKYGNIVLSYYKQMANNSEYLDYYETSVRTRDLAYFGSNGNVTVVTESYNAYDEDIAMVQIYFKSASLIQIGRRHRMTWVDFFSNVGGLLGLVLGLGILSFVELVWLCLRLGAQKLNLTHWVP